jgi:hypothetical protein
MRKLKLCAMLVSAALATSASAKTLWMDDFENGLTKWVGKNNAPATSFGRIESDPVNSGRGKVVTFPSKVIEGAIFSTFSVNHKELKKPLRLEFDYLGMPNRGGVAGDLGGYIGYARNPNPGPGSENHRWVGGTNPNYSIYKGDNYIHLEDDGQWHRYVVDLSAADFPNFQLMLEDYEYAGGVAGDAYFDNIVLTDADGQDKPEPPKPVDPPVKPIDPPPVKPIEPIKPIDPPKPPIDQPKPPVAPPIKPIDPPPVKPVEPIKPVSCQCATYTVSDHSLNVPEVKMSLSNALTGETVGEPQRFAARMKRFELYSTAKGTVYGFNVLCDTTSELVSPNANPQCAAVLDKGTLTIPCVEIPANGLCGEDGNPQKKCTTSEKYEVVLDKITSSKTCNNCNGLETNGGMSFVLREMKKIDEKKFSSTSSTTIIETSTSTSTVTTTNSK